MTGRKPKDSRRGAAAGHDGRRRIFAEPGRNAVRALVAVALMAGVAGEPRPSSSQQPAEPQYRVVRPEGEGPHPALLFVSGCSGFTPHEAPYRYGLVAEDFASRGFVVVFVDYLGARGRDVCGGMVRPNDVVGDILAAAAYARARPFIRASDISVIGWSMGGGGVMAAIAELPADAPAPFRAAVAYYPECYGVGTPWQARVPLLMLLGGLDEVSPARVCQELVRRLASDLPIEVRVYPAARHAFDVPELPPLLRRARGGPLGHDPQAASAAREEVKRFLGR
jgi:dienelactone hydrolase